jgi:alkanesulfonate monooxygenase SsuD/methylene tetrahydromethanopterin reductase-like flavin-dependent oxidoreductase (luciferase family)
VEPAAHSAEYLRTVMAEKPETSFHRPHPARPLIHASCATTSRAQFCRMLADYFLLQPATAPDPREGTRGLDMVRARATRWPHGSAARATILITWPRGLLGRWGAYCSR